MPKLRRNDSRRVYDQRSHKSMEQEGTGMDKQRTIIVILAALVLMLTTIIFDLFGVMG